MPVDSSGFAEMSKSLFSFTRRAQRLGSSGETPSIVNLGFRRRKKEQRSHLVFYRRPSPVTRPLAVGD